MNAGITSDLRIYNNLGVTTRVAYKTRGYLTGHPIDEGLHGYFGVVFALDRDRCSLLLRGWMVTALQKNEPPRMEGVAAADVPRESKRSAVP